MKIVQWIMSAMWVTSLLGAAATGNWTAMAGWACAVMLLVVHWDNIYNIDGE